MIYNRYQNNLQQAGTKHTEKFTEKKIKNKQKQKHNT